MDNVVQSFVTAAVDSVEIIVYVKELLDETRRTELVSVLQQDQRIVSAEFCPLRFHLMLVRYGRDAIASQDVLGLVQAHWLDARLIGPV